MRSKARHRIRQHHGPGHGRGAAAADLGVREESRRLRSSYSATNLEGRDRSCMHHQSDENHIQHTDNHQHYENLVRF